jgi:hypothetical protein
MKGRPMSLRLNWQSVVSAEDRLSCKGGVYKVCIDDAVVYVGQSRDMGRRIRHHWYGASLFRDTAGALWIHFPFGSFPVNAGMAFKYAVVVGCAARSEAEWRLIEKYRPAGNLKRTGRKPSRLSNDEIAIALADGPVMVATLAKGVKRGQQ